MGCGMSRLDPRTDDNHYPVAKHKTPFSSLSSSPKLDNPSSIISNHNVNINRRSVSSPVTRKDNIVVDREEEYDNINNGRISNLDDDVNNAGSLWIGSPSFREYCIVSKDSVDVDNLLDSHVNAGKKDTSEEREINMQEEDKLMTASNEVSKTVATPKKRSTGKKLRNVFHFPGRQMVES